MRTTTSSPGGTRSGARSRPGSQTAWLERGTRLRRARPASARARLIDSSPGDTILLAGKGHETYQIIGTESLDFDDREVARAGGLWADRTPQPPAEVFTPWRRAQLELTRHARELPDPDIGRAPDRGRR